MDYDIADPRGISVRYPNPGKVSARRSTTSMTRRRDSGGIRDLLRRRTGFSLISTSLKPPTRAKTAKSGPDRSAANHSVAHHGSIPPARVILCQSKNLRCSRKARLPVCARRYARMNSKKTSTGWRKRISVSSR